MGIQSSTEAGLNSAAKARTRRNWKGNLVEAAYLTCCAYLTGFSEEPGSIRYFVGMLLGVIVVFIVIRRILFHLAQPLATEQMEEIATAAMLTAATAAIMANVALQTTVLRHPHSPVPRGAIISVYCALLLLGCPMPLLPGERLFYKVGQRARAIVFLAVIVSSIWRVGMLVPALFVYFDRNSLPPVGPDAVGKHARRLRAMGIVVAGLGATAAVGTVLLACRN